MVIQPQPTVERKPNSPQLGIASLNVRSFSGKSGRRRPLTTLQRRRSRQLETSAFHHCCSLPSAINCAPSRSANEPSTHESAPSAGGALTVAARSQHTAASKLVEIRPPILTTKRRRIASLWGRRSRRESNKRERESGKPDFAVCHFGRKLF